MLILFVDTIFVDGHVVSGVTIGISHLNLAFVVSLEEFGSKGSRCTLLVGLWRTIGSIFEAAAGSPSCTCSSTRHGGS